MDSNIISDPNVNYNLLESEILKANRKFMPTKFVKFRKYKHKINNWMTPGILKSIKYRDKLYKDLKITNPNISQYDDIHKRSIPGQKDILCAIIQYT